jgi:hypothetical protein
MRIAIILAGTGLLAALFTARTGPAVAQLPPQLAVGQMEVKAYEKIPKAKAAVQLSQDTALGRQLRGKVMERLQKRGMEVGFSGGNVMRMDVNYFALNLGGGGSTPGNSAADTPSSASPGDNPRPPVFNQPITRDGSSTPSRPPTLSLTFTLYSVSSGKVLWTATGSCATVGGMAPRAGEAVINAIFDNADKSIVGDANCPL